MGLGKVGLDDDRLAEGGDGVVELTLILERIAEV